MPGSLRVLLADTGSPRATLLERRLRDIADAVVLGVAGGDGLRDAVVALAPDVILVDMPLPDRERLDELRRIGADRPCPVVMFAAFDSRAFLEEAIAAGVNSYHVVATALPDIAPILFAAVAVFRRQQQTDAALSEAKAMLQERETINRAKSLLMRQHRIGEPQAYRWLRRRAMNESRRLGEIAADLLAAAADGPK